MNRQTNVPKFAQHGQDAYKLQMLREPGQRPGGNAPDNQTPIRHVFFEWTGPSLRQGPAVISFIQCKHRMEISSATLPATQMETGRYRITAPLRESFPVQVAIQTSVRVDLRVENSVRKKIYSQSVAQGRGGKKQSRRYLVIQEPGYTSRGYPT